HFQELIRGTCGNPAAIQAFQPPRSARALLHPPRLNSCATRALVASFGQAQITARIAALASCCCSALLTALSGCRRIEPGIVSVLSLYVRSVRASTTTNPDCTRCNRCTSSMVMYSGSLTACGATATMASEQSASASSQIAELTP